MTVPFPVPDMGIAKRSVLIPPLVMRIPLVLLRSRFRREKEDSLWNWLAVRPVRFRRLVHLVLCREQVVDISSLFRSLRRNALPVAQGT